VDVVADTLDGWLYLPLRGFCIRRFGAGQVELLEAAANEGRNLSFLASSSRGSRSLPGDQVRSRYLGRLLDRPNIDSQAAQIAPAQVIRAARLAQEFVLISGYLVIILNWFHFVKIELFCLAGDKCF